jgi:hypothetical protein
MPYWFDPFVGIAIVNVPMYVLSFLGPVVFSGQEFKCSCPPWVSCNQGIIVIMQEAEAEFIVLGNPDQSFIH